MELNDKVIGQNLKRIRKKKSITQEELAKKINVSRALIARWETGLNSISLKNAIKISEVLSVDMNIFLETQNIDEERFYRVPLMEDIKYDSPMYSEDQVKEYKMIPFRYKRKGEYFYLKADGSSMRSIGVDDGDFLLMKRVNELNNNEIGAFYIKGKPGIYLRIYKKDEKGITLSTSDDKEKEIFIPKDDLDSFIIIAKLEQVDKSVYSIEDIIKDN